MVLQPELRGAWRDSIDPLSTGPDRALTGAEPTARPIPFHSILFDRPYGEAEIDQCSDPSFFVDLNLDQLFTAVAEERPGVRPPRQDHRRAVLHPDEEIEPLDPYHLRPFFCLPLHDPDAITYRQQVMRDLEENESLRTEIYSFAQSMRSMREHLARVRKLPYHYQQASWFIDAVEIYCDAVQRLAVALPQHALRSRGLQAFADFLTTYVQSDAFQSLAVGANTIKAHLATVTYCVLIKDSRLTVRKYEGEPDYSREIEATFEKFRQGAVKDYRLQFVDSAEMNHIEAIILDFVARLYPDIFGQLHTFFEERRDYVDPTIRRFDREIQFYLAYLEFIQPLKAAGLHFCYPQVSASKEIHAKDTFDIALAHKCVSQGGTVVCNDLYLTGPERIFVVSGPNNGGKTTFARIFGQLHYLASLGYPVPGNSAQLFLYDQLFTHFEKVERLENLRGKLQDELIRIHEILQQATCNSIIIMNESFASATLADALFLGQQIIQQLLERDILGVYVTFIDELSRLSAATVSMVATVAPENPAQRTFRIVRKPADGLAYAAAIAEKYGLSFEAITRRLAR